nr:hypothetical protein Q903MT_gene3623 [Picea sitchensis]
MFRHSPSPFLGPYPKSVRRSFSPSHLVGARSLVFHDVFKLPIQPTLHTRPSKRAQRSFAGTLASTDYSIGIRV